MTQEEQKLNDLFNAGVFKPKIVLEPKEKLTIKPMTEDMLVELFSKYIEESNKSGWKNFASAFCNGKIIPKNLGDKI